LADVIVGWCSEGLGWRRWTEKPGYAWKYVSDTLLDPAEELIVKICDMLAELGV
jgi:hypothetical protein